MKKKEPINTMEITMRDIFFTQIDPARRQEKKDSRMIQEDHSKVANLSQTPLHHEFNQNKYVERFRQNVYEVTGD